MRSLARFQQVGMILICTIGTPPLLSASASSPRKEALEQLDRSIQEVRRFMNSDPERMDQNLWWYMARPIGYHPKVLGICDEVILESTNTISVLRAVGAVEGLLSFHADQMKSPGRKKAAEKILKHALENKSLLVRLQAADALRLANKDVMIRSYSQIFSSPDLLLDDNTRWSMILGVKHLLETGQPAAIDAVRTATERYGLLKFYETALAEGNFRGQKEENEALLEKWRGVVKR